MFDRALTALVAELERRRFAATERPRPARPAVPRSRHVPADVRRTVARRDGQRCAFVAGDGRRCEATTFLEFHHVTPYGVGGAATLANIQLRCAAHNRHEAQTYYVGAERDRMPSGAAPWPTGDSVRAESRGSGPARSLSE